MEAEQTAPTRRYPRGITIAAYVTWAAVAIEVFRNTGTAPAVGPVPARAVAAALLGLYILGFVIASRPSETDRPLRHQWPLALMLAALFTLLVLFPSGTSPALIVVFAVLAVLALPVRLAIVVLVVANA